MRFTIDSSILSKEGLSMKEFSVLLFYLNGGTGVLNEEYCTELWSKGFLIKVIDGYIPNNNKYSEIESLIAESNNADKINSIEELAKALRDLFPEGKKLGTNYYWRDSNAIITKRLSTFFSRYGNTYSNEDILKATKNYVESFDGNYQYMQLLKYFIFKKAPGGEETSQLLSYLENIDQEDSISNKDWTTECR